VILSEKNQLLLFDSLQNTTEINLEPLCEALSIDESIQYNYPDQLHVYN
jgi:hypothetical protein